MTELVTFGETSLRLSPEGKERLESAADVRLRTSGTESNVAVAAASMGADATWLSRVPDSPLGRRVVSDLHARGVEPEVAWASEGRQGLFFSEHEHDPRAGRLLQDRDGTAMADVTPGDLPMGVVQSADGVFVAGSTVALSTAAAETAEAVLRASGDATTAFDLDFQPGLWSAEAARETLDGLLEAVDVFVANEDQAKDVFNRTGSPREMAHTLASKLDFELVVITRSSRGAVVWHDNVIHEQDGVETDAVDPAGQHEAFTGAFLARWLDGAPADRALSEGVAAAALTRTIPGAMTTITRDEVAALADEIRGGR